MLYFRESASIQTYSTLLPICIGVAISCIHDSSFSIFGFTAAGLSNICFSSRAVLTKHLYRIQPGCMAEVSLFTHISIIGSIVLIPLVIIAEGKQIITLFQDTQFDFVTLITLLILNGIAYSTYNFTSFLVLGRSDLVTHAVLNVFRRVFIIIFTSYYFSIHLSSLNIFGVGLAVVGVLLFGYSRMYEKK